MYYADSLTHLMAYHIQLHAVITLAQRTATTQTLKAGMEKAVENENGDSSLRLIEI
jgi:hypothetical protein